MGTEEFLIKLKHLYQEKADFYKRVGHQGWASYFEKEVIEVERRIQIYKKNKA